MTMKAVPDAAHAWFRAGLRRAAPALLLGLVALGLLFRAEIAAALAIWESSTAYGHCFFVLPIALYLAWDRRASISGTPIVPLPYAALLAFPLAAAWLAAERVGLMEGRQLVAIALLQVVFLSVLGWRMWRALAVPLLYLFFLVPFGAFVTPALQGFTARFIVAGLNLLGISNYADNYIIEIREGTFYVAEACAGLRFLIAAIAFGVLYACLMYRSPIRRIVFIAASIAIPVVANGFRGLGIVVLGHIIGSAEAAVADHVIYGWVFFSVVILLLIAAGLPFREDGVGYRPILGRLAPTREASLAGSSMAALLAIALAGAGPAAAALIDRGAGAALAALDPRFAAPVGCAELPAGSLAAPDAGVATIAAHGFECGPVRLTATTITLAPRANPAAVLNAMRRATGELDAEDTESHPLPGPGAEPSPWRLVETDNPARLTATSLWVGGLPTRPGVAFRLDQAWRGITGASHAIVVIAVSVDPGVPHFAPQARDAISRTLAAFVAAQTGLPAEIAARSDASAPR